MKTLCFVVCFMLLFTGSVLAIENSCIKNKITSEIKNDINDTSNDQNIISFIPGTMQLTDESKTFIFNLPQNSTILVNKKSLYRNSNNNDYIDSISEFIRSTNKNIRITKFDTKGNRIIKK